MANEKLMKTEVYHLMTSELITVSPDSTMQEVREIFDANRIHHIPVVKADGQLEGILGRREYYILLDHFSLFNKKSVDTVNQNFLRSILVKEVMKENPVAINESGTVEEAYEIFNDNLIQALPVINSSGKLTGILTTFDLLKHAFEGFE